MASSPNLLILPVIFLSVAAISLPFISCQDGPRNIIYCDGFTLESHSDTFNETISAVLKFTPSTGFAYSKLGSSAYSLSWCRGDFSADRCSTCLATATQKLRDTCSERVVAARSLFQDFCYLGLDVQEFNTIDTSFRRIWYDKTGKKIVGGHRRAHRTSIIRLLNELMLAIPQQKRMFGVMDTYFDVEKSKIYGMGQCAQVLSKELCFFCLEQAISDVMARCMNRRACEVFYGSCFVKYDTQKIIF